MQDIRGFNRTVAINYFSCACICNTSGHSELDDLNKNVSFYALIIIVVFLSASSGTYITVHICVTRCHYQSVDYSVSLMH